MAPRKEPKSSLGRTARYYRENPEARKKKAATDKKINARPEQRAKRSELTTRNRKYDKKYGKASRRGKDASHQANGDIRYTNSSKNRGNKTSTKGDRNARGRKGEGAR